LKRQYVIKHSARYRQGHLKTY